MYEPEGEFGVGIALYTTTPCLQLINVRMHSDWQEGLKLGDCENRADLIRDFAPPVKR